MALLDWKIEGLNLAHIFAEYVLWLMVTFLTHVWELNYKTAAAAINIFWGLVGMLPLLVQYIIDSYVGNYRMALLSTFMYTTGLGFLSISAIGICENTKTCHVKKRYKFSLLLAIPQLLVGLSYQRSDSINQLIAATKELGDNNKLRPPKWERFLRIVALIVVHLVGTFILPNINKWAFRFGVPTLCMLAAIFIFWTGSNSYHKPKPSGSFLTTMLKVILAGLRPIKSNQLEYDNSGTHYGYRLRCLDKAIITGDEEQRDKVIEDVRKTKQAISRIPFFLAFFMLGIVSSIGDSYFIQQADYMNTMIRGYDVPIVVLQLWYELSKSLLKKIYLEIKDKLPKKSNNVVSSKCYGCVGITVSMIFAILCCFVAAAVDKMRCNKVNSANMFWLLPQFFFLGGFEGILEESIEMFFTNSHPLTSFDHTMRLVPKSIFGIGSICSVLLTFVVQKVSAWGDNTSWFVEDLNESRLDKYFFLLGGLSIANLVYYTFVYYFTSLRSEVKDSRSEVNESNT
ncbi:protein NRT1/ PTR FAMILY 5.5-like [Cannabis sativa]|nr:protein NRT1/ PTR FAMILY 5.5-like [Cannabis sativa]